MTHFFLSPNAVTPRQVAANCSRAVGGACYHGAFATGLSLHAERWVDVGGGDQGAFKVEQGGCQLSKSGKVRDVSGANHPHYTVRGSSTRFVNGNYTRQGERGGAPRALAAQSSLLQKESIFRAFLRVFFEDIAQKGVSFNSKEPQKNKPTRCFANESGVLLFRATLLETPELFITAPRTAPGFFLESVESS